MNDPRIEFFDNLSEGWDNEEPLPNTMINKLKQLSEQLGFASGMDVLEVGCGTGKLTGWLAGKVAPGRVTAVDFAPEMIFQAQEKDIHADFHCLDICDYKAEQGFAKKFDMIFCFHCFPHFREQALALRNLAGVMKPEGRLIVMHLAGSDHINSFHANLDGPVRHDILPEGNDWIPLLHQASLEKTQLIDQENLFFLEAVHRSRQKPNTTSQALAALD